MARSGRILALFFGLMLFACQAQKESGSKTPSVSVGASVSSATPALASELSMLQTQAGTGEQITKTELEELLAGGTISQEQYQQLLLLAN